MDGLTTNGVLIMQPESGFNLKCEQRSWKEASVCGNMFSLRSSRSAPKSGEKVSTKQFNHTLGTESVQEVVFSLFSARIKGNKKEGEQKHILIVYRCIDRQATTRWDFPYNLTLHPIDF